MKRWLLIYTLVLCGTSLFCQSACHDEIYALEENRVVYDCCILKIMEGNVVICAVNGDTLIVPAAAVCKDGIYQGLYPEDSNSYKTTIVKIEDPVLYRGHDYEYYDRRRDAAEGQQIAGILLTGMGVMIEGVWLATKTINDSSFYANFHSSGMETLGLIYISVGVPLWISGAVMAANSKEAMNEIRLSNSIAIGIGRYGVGVKLRF